MTTMTQQIIADVLSEKYARGSEKAITGLSALRTAIRQRIAGGLAANEANPELWEPRFVAAMEAGFIPAGRVNSACGTDIKATLQNCYVQAVGDAMIGVDDDGLPGITIALAEAAETMRRGGGVGYNFSAIRPKGALVKGTQSSASGPLSYMAMFDAMCATVVSAGERRGAQMGILDVSHPDIELFVDAKKDGSLKKFNISVGMTDEFFGALKRGDTEFQLVHKRQPGPAQLAAGAFQREDGLWVYKTIDPRALFDRIMRNTYEFAEPGMVILSRMNAENNLWYAEVIRATNPCGEQPLPAYGCCCLGSVDLTKFVHGAFSPVAIFNRREMEAAVTLAVRMMDNVLDVSLYPLQAQRDEAMAKRRIGLGYTGLGDALVMLGLRYDSDEGRRMAEDISRTLCHAAYRASVELAKEKGAFPLLDREKYLQAPLIQRLPEDIRAGIAEHGIRNSHLTSIAPTGTISLAFADNASNGIEPAFSWFYDRKKVMADGSDRWYKVVDPAFAAYRELQGIPEEIDGVQNPEFFRTDDLPEEFVDALSISAKDHAAMMAVVQPYIDSSISKTVNVPADYPFEDFKELYLWAYDNGLKGLATFRPNAVTGSVLAVSQPEPKVEETDPDRKIRITDVPKPALDSLRWPKRPKTPKGAEGKVYMVDHPETPFSVFVSHYQNGRAKPFEVWVNGAEVPRTLGALAKSLSMDMRCSDRAWLELKLSAIAKTESKPFDTQWVDGGEREVSSAAAAMAMLVKHRVDELQDAAVEDDVHPMVDAMFAKKEPKGSGMAWCWDVKNFATGDDFALFIKEVQLPDGSVRPASFWASGVYPKEMDGLLKSLSLDARIIDVAWIGQKLRSLRDFPEAQGDCMMRTPGSDKSAHYPSTVAYLAAVILYRYQLLGLLDAEGFPITKMGLFAEQEATVARESSPIIPGEKCPECGAKAYIKQGGCKRCTACGHLGECG